MREWVRVGFRVPVFASAVRSAGARTVSRAVAPCAARCFSTTFPRAAIKYAKSHEWAKLEGDIATIRISDHAQQELGDIVYVDLPEAAGLAAASLYDCDEAFGEIGRASCRERV